MTFIASVTFDNSESLVFELEEYQVTDFMKAVVNKCPYEDAKTGVISWLPPDKVHHIVIKPNLEIPQCPQNLPLDLESVLLS